MSSASQPASHSTAFSLGACTALASSSPVCRSRRCGPFLRNLGLQRRVAAAAAASPALDASPAVAAPVKVRLLVQDHDGESAEYEMILSSQQSLDRLVDMHGGLGLMPADAASGQLVLRDLADLDAGARYQFVGSPAAAVDPIRSLKSFESSLVKGMESAFGQGALKLVQEAFQGASMEPTLRVVGPAAGDRHFGERGAAMELDGVIRVAPGHIILLSCKTQLKMTAVSSLLKKAKAIKERAANPAEWPSFTHAFGPIYDIGLIFGCNTIKESEKEAIVAACDGVARRH